MIPNIRSRVLSVSLFHISFKNNLAGIWQPVLPAGMELGSGKYPEPKQPRISVSPDVIGCFRGVFPNVSKFFEEKNFPHMDFYVYSPVFDGGERIWTPELLTTNKAVWDAHVTKEHSILDSVTMGRVGEVRIYNTNKSPTMMTHPFDDINEPEQSVGPKEIKFKWL